MSRRSVRFALVISTLAALGLHPAITNADTITVCWDGSGDYLTIQAGIDAAQDADEVVVCDGTYTGDGNRDLDFLGKAITLRSASGDPEACIIDCQGSESDPHRGFWFHSGETNASVLEGLTIRNGYATQGGGILCEASSPTITSCVVTGNDAGERGGGLACQAGSDLEITNCAITGNTVTYDHAWLGGGGGMHCSESSPVISNCTISDNAAMAQDDNLYSGGGGVCCAGYSNPTITDCTISGNIADTLGVRGLPACGGGVSCWSYSSASITNCIIAGNMAGRCGGGIFTYSSRASTVSDSRITENQALDKGGGFAFLSGSHTVSRCSIDGNDGGTAGGGVHCQSGSVSIMDCSITRNWASILGGGVDCLDSTAVITNCLIVENVASMGGGIDWQVGGYTITNCTITRNIASGSGTNAGGGGIRCAVTSSDTMIANCVITDNTTNGSGGAVACFDNTVVTVPIVNCTLAGNTAAQYGGAVCSSSYSHVRISNCLLWGDSAPLGSEVALRSSQRPSSLTVAYGAVQGGQAAACVEDGCELIWGEGNLDADPLFFDPDGPDDDPNTWEDNDYRLSAGSPCIDAADNGAVPADSLDLDDDGDTDEPLPFDLAGLSRFVNDPDTDDTGLSDPDFPDLPIVDMGAYEFQACAGDLDGDGDTDQSDLGILLADWGCQSDCIGDLDGDDDTDQADLGILLGNWRCGT